MKKEAELVLNDTKNVEAKIAVIRETKVIADADVAALYGVETKRVNEAVRNNRDKFPADYMFELSKSELRDLMSKISSTNVSLMNRNSTKVFTEKGLYDNGRPVLLLRSAKPHLFSQRPAASIMVVTNCDQFAPQTIVFNSLNSQIKYYPTQ